MKKLLIILIVLIISLITLTKTSAQFKDLQLHYEMGSFKRGVTTVNRGFYKTKFQILHADSLGLMYLNTEFDYNSPTKGVSFGQYSILRSLKIKKLSKFIQPTVGHAAALGVNNQFFAGILVPMKFGKVTIFPLILYAYNRDAKSPDARFMVGVSAKLLNNRIQIFGFASSWTYDNTVAPGEVKGKKAAWQIAPQIWFHATRAFAIGSKIDYSKNLYSKDGTPDFLPTAGVRWVFK